MAYGIDTVYEKETGNKVTFAPSKNIVGGVESIAIWNNGQLKNISLNDLRKALGITSCWGSYGFEKTGWRRIAKITGYSASSCDISIKREYNKDNNESHKAQLLCAHFNVKFKSVYDKSNTQLFKKVRYTRTGTNAYIDVLYESENYNTLTISITDNISCSGNAWTMLDAQIVPETADGETILAEMDFGENTWMGQPL